MSNQTLNLILSSNPHVILVGGPPFYLSNHKVDFSKIRSGLINLEKIVEKIPITILEHHALRNKNWRKKTKKLFNIANKNGNKIITAAEFSSKENKLLEANRKELYRRFPLSPEFRQWIQHVITRKSSIKPPI
jgi:predicted metallo-beta-lactamase superfamily hydrolase